MGSVIRDGGYSFGIGCKEIVRRKRLWSKDSVEIRVQPRELVTLDALRWNSLIWRIGNEGIQGNQIGMFLIWAGLEGNMSGEWEGKFCNWDFSSLKRKVMWWAGKNDSFTVRVISMVSAVISNSYFLSCNKVINAIAHTFIDTLFCGNYL